MFQRRKFITKWCNIWIVVIVLWGFINVAKSTFLGNCFSAYVNKRPSHNVESLYRSLRTVWVCLSFRYIIKPPWPQHTLPWCIMLYPGRLYMDTSSLSFNHVSWVRMTPNVQFYAFKSSMSTCTSATFAFRLCAFNDTTLNKFLFSCICFYSV